MGTAAEVITPTEGGTRKAESQGGVRIVRKFGTYTFPATYATGGDTVPQPDAPAGGTLISVHIVHADAPAGMTPKWTGNTTTVKILVTDEDNTSGISAELANANAAMSGLALHLEWIYRIGA